MRHFKFHETIPGSVKPAGHLLEFLRRQRKGISGHFEKQGFPFNTPMWNGGVGEIIAASVIYGDGETRTPGQEEWWPYEQSAYLIDGILRLAILLEDKSLLNIARNNIEYLLNHPDEEGKLGRCYGNIDPEWPLAVFFRAVLCWGRFAATPAVSEALRRHFAALPERVLADGFRHINNLEAILRLEDDTLTAKAESAYLAHDALNREKENEEFELNWSKLVSQKDFSIHGVSFSESVKLPVLLFGATGKQEYLDCAVNALDRILDRHEQLPGLISSNENLAGRDPLQGYETCVISDFSWTLGYFLMATGDARYADRIEKIVYNALPGSILKDFSALEYLSSVNQTISAAWSNHSFFYRGSASFRQYRPDHSAQCCGGNIHRVMPNFVMRIFLTDSEGAPVTAFYGPAEYSGNYRNFAYRISAKTEYPFAETVNFHLFLPEGQTLPFTFRIPSWCASPRLKINGVTQPVPSTKNGFSRLETLRNKDKIELTFPMEARHLSERNWSWFEVGPLLFSLPVPQKIRKEKPGTFVPRVITPTGRWSFGIEPQATAEVVRRPNSKDPWKFPPISLKTNGFPLSGWDVLEEGRYTPPLPLFGKKNGKNRSLTLRPYGSTALRITAFPDGVERELFPIYQVLALSQPETPDSGTFLRTGAELYPSPSGYYDLNGVFPTRKSAWLLFRFRAINEETATFAVGASTHAECFVNGEKSFDLPYPFEAEFMAPLQFHAKVVAGYNELLLHVFKGFRYFQYRPSWGAKVHIFRKI